MLVLVLVSCTPESAQTSPDFASAGFRPGFAPNAEVIATVDGDTVRLRFASGDEVVRLLGVDTPETVDPNRAAQCYGAEASAFVAELLPPGTQVLVTRDLQARDKFGRLLGYIYRAADGTFVNIELLRQGYADTLSIEPNTTFRSQFAQAKRQAAATRSGLWGICDGPDQPLDR